VPVLSGIVAVVLVVANAVGAVLNAHGFPDRNALAVQVAVYALLAPAALAGVFVVARSRRSLGRYLRAFCILSALIAGANFVRAAVELQKPPQVVSGTDSPVEITVPASWRTSERKNVSQSIHVVDPLAATAVLVASLRKSETEASFDQFVAAMLERQKGMKGLVALGGPQACAVASVPCAAYEIRHSNDDTVSVQLVNFVDGRTHYHIVMALADEPLLERARPKLVEIMASFRDRSEAVTAGQ
jgi:hypothetical protein